MKISNPIIRYLVLGLLFMQVVWLISANLLLNTAWGHGLANSKPQVLSVDWDSGWSFYPGHLKTNNFDFKLHTPALELAAKFDQISARIHLLSLFFKKVIIDRANGSVESIAIVRNPDYSPPDMPGKIKSSFFLELRDININNIDTFKYNDIEVSGGQAQIEGTMVVQTEADSRIESLSASWLQADIQLADREFSDRVNVELNISQGSFNPRFQKGIFLFERFSGDFKLDGGVGSLAPLRFLFPDAKWIEGVDGEGTVDIDLVFESGALGVGSVIDVDASGLELSFLGFRANGVGRIDGSVVQSQGEQLSEMAVVFDKYSLARHDATAPLAQGKGLRLQIEAPQLGPAMGLEDVRVELDIPESQFPDITILGSNLPDALGLTVTDGNAVLKGHIEASGAAQEVSGEVLLSGRSLQGRFRDMGFSMDMDITTQLSGRQLDDFRVELNDTEFKLYNGIFDNEVIEVEEQWWMTISAPHGYAKLSSPAVMEADVSLAMKDTRAIIAIFAEVKDWIKYFDNILSVNDVHGTAKLSAADQEFMFRNIDIEGDKLQLMAELKAKSGVHEGIFWGKLGIFSIGVELIDQQSNWKIIDGQAWYEKKKAENWTTPLHN